MQRSTSSMAINSTNTLLFLRGPGGTCRFFSSYRTISYADFTKSLFATANGKDNARSSDIVQLDKFLFDFKSHLLFQKNKDSTIINSISVSSRFDYGCLKKLVQFVSVRKGLLATHAFIMELLWQIRNEFSRASPSSFYSYQTFIEEKFSFKDFKESIQSFIYWISKTNAYEAYLTLMVLDKEAITLEMVNSVLHGLSLSMKRQSGDGCATTHFLLMQELFDFLVGREWGFGPNSVSYHILIKACLRENRTDRAQALYQMANEDNALNEKLNQLTVKQEKENLEETISDKKYADILELCKGNEFEAAFEKITAIKDTLYEMNNSSWLNSIIFALSTVLDVKMSIKFYNLIFECNPKIAVEAERSFVPLLFRIIQRDNKEGIEFYKKAANSLLSTAHNRPFRISLESLDKLVEICADKSLLLNLASADSRIFLVVLKDLIECEQFSAAEDLLLNNDNEIFDFDSRFTLFADKLIHSRLSHNQVEQSFDFVFKYIQLNRLPSASTLSSLAKQAIDSSFSLHSKKLFELLLSKKLLSEAISCGIHLIGQEQVDELLFGSAICADSVNIFTINSYLKTLTLLNNPLDICDRMKKVINFMKQKQIFPNIKTAKILFDLSSAMPDLAMLSSVKATLWNEFHFISSALAAAAEIKCKLLLNHGNFNQFNLLSESDKKKVLNAAIKQSKYKLANSLLSLGKDNNVLNEEQIRLLIARRQFNSALSFIKQTESKNATSFMHFFHCANPPSSALLEELMLLMESNGVVVNNRCYIKLMQAWTQESDHSKLTEFMQKTLRSGNSLLLSDFHFVSSAFVCLKNASTKLAIKLIDVFLAAISKFPQNPPLKYISESNLNFLLLELFNKKYSPYKLFQLLQFLFNSSLDAEFIKICNNYDLLLVQAVLMNGGSAAKDVSFLNSLFDYLTRKNPPPSCSLFEEIGNAMFELCLSHDTLTKKIVLHFGYSEEKAASLFLFNHLKTSSPQECINNFLRANDEIFSEYFINYLHLSLNASSTRRLLPSWLLRKFLRNENRSLFNVCANDVKLDLVKLYKKDPIYAKAYFERIKQYSLIIPKEYSFKHLLSEFSLHIHQKCSIASFEEGEEGELPTPTKTQILQALLKFINKGKASQFERLMQISNELNYFYLFEGEDWKILFKELLIKNNPTDDMFKVLIDYAASEMDCMETINSVLLSLFSDSSSAVHYDSAISLIEKLLNLHPHNDDLIYELRNILDITKEILNNGEKWSLLVRVNKLMNK